LFGGDSLLLEGMPDGRRSQEDGDTEWRETSWNPWQK
jgi:hypothetical protein